MSIEITEIPWVWNVGDCAEFYVAGIPVIGRIALVWNGLVFIRSEDVTDGSGWWRSQYELTRIAEDGHG